MSRDKSVTSSSKYNKDGHLTGGSYKDNYTNPF